MAKDRPLYAANPTGEAFEKMVDDGRRFRVLHDGFGRFRKGAVVSLKDMGPGAQVPRHVALGAIAELSPHEVAALEGDDAPEAPAARAEAPDQSRPRPELLAPGADPAARGAEASGLVAGAPDATRADRPGRDRNR